MKRWILFSFCCLTIPLLAEEKEPTVDQIIASVEKQIGPDTKDLPEKAADAASVVGSAELILHREIRRSKDRKLRVIYAISSLNSSIRYIEEQGLKEREKTDYERMVRFREILAKEYLTLSK